MVAPSDHGRNQRVVSEDVSGLKALTVTPSTAILVRLVAVEEAVVGILGGMVHMGKRVLLIEDEPNIIEAISFVLSRDGFTVHTHEDGETAMDKVRATPPDMVILDVMLPGRSGFDILRDLRDEQETADTPVLMLTARGQTKDRELAMRLGANHFMTKPFSNREFRDHIREVLGE
jgi:CheY-like chemotaxis protein